MRICSPRRPKRCASGGEGEGGAARGDIHWANLREPVGSKPGYHRPVLIVSAGRRLLAIEANLTAVPDRRDTHHLRWFLDRPLQIRRPQWSSLWTSTPTETETASRSYPRRRWAPPCRILSAR